ncbi:hypothetical protein CIW48_05200 [Methylobacterium sp. P1-11]|uniref:hypothetical protein n=1 Tax=Methylobacterium sp. P1-11 TaxID=2024616 RepID=UPI0011EEE729|nr:hypothetical protein [Methylobacterium sp. P1-11]KAA0125124.1 hypothetical protein CIW48_05200 [Methylobacterium sp. P1-11]
MPHAARTGLAALMLALGLGSASAESVATTWTDPPAHKPAAEKAPAADQKVAAPAPAATTPAASTRARPASSRRKAVAARHVPEKTARAASPGAKRVAATPRRARVVAAPTRTIRSAPQSVAAAPPPPPEGYARYRAYNYGPGYGYAPAYGYAQGYTDDRLDRLSSAQAAGYVVVRRRTVQFPDGRTLRVYRPDDEGEPF